MKTSTIKNLFMKVAIMALFMSVVSCDEEKIIMHDSTDLNLMNVENCHLYFDKGDDPKVVKVGYEKNDWMYNIEEGDWIHVSRDGKKKELTVQVDENRTRETRSGSIIIYDSKATDIKTKVSVTQKTSLTLVECQESELTFASSEGASNTLSIWSNGEWRVRRIPEWLRASVSKGTGSQTISLITLSANSTSSERTGTVVIGTSDEEVQIPIRQYGGVSANCQVSPKNITILSNGIAFDMDFSHASKVAHYYRGYIEASRAGIMTNPEIISTLQREFQRHLPSDDEVVDFSDLKPNTNYIIYTLAYDMEGKRGELLSTEVKTCKDETNGPCGWISDVECTGSYWEWNVTKSATCYSYWMMTTENRDIALASDVLQAWWLEEAIRHNMVTEYLNGGDWRQRRTGNMIAVWTRGMTSNGTWAGKISWKGCELSSSEDTRSSDMNASSSQALEKRCVKEDHSGRKLSPDQYCLYHRTK